MAKRNMSEVEKLLERMVDILEKKQSTQRQPTISQLNRLYRDARTLGYNGNKDSQAIKAFLGAKLAKLTPKERQEFYLRDKSKDHQRFIAEITGNTRTSMLETAMKFSNFTSRFRKRKPTDISEQELLDFIEEARDNGFESDISIPPRLQDSFDLLWDKIVETFFGLEQSQVILNYVSRRDNDKMAMINGGGLVKQNDVEQLLALRHSIQKIYSNNQNYNFSDNGDILFKVEVFDTNGNSTVRRVRDSKTEENCLIKVFREHLNTYALHHKKPRKAINKLLDKVNTDVYENGMTIEQGEEVAEKMPFNTNFYILKSCDSKLYNPYHLVKSVDKQSSIRALDVLLFRDHASKIRDLKMPKEEFIETENYEHHIVSQQELIAKYVENPNCQIRLTANGEGFLVVDKILYKTYNPISQPKAVSRTNEAKLIANTERVANLNRSELLSKKLNDCCPRNVMFKFQEVKKQYYKYDKCNSYRACLYNAINEQPDGLKHVKFNGFPVRYDEYKITDQTLVNDILEKFEGEAYITIEQELTKFQKQFYPLTKGVYQFVKIRALKHYNIAFKVEYVRISRMLQPADKLFGKLMTAKGKEFNLMFNALNGNFKMNDYTNTIISQSRADIIDVFRYCLHNEITPTAWNCDNGDSDVYTDLTSVCIGTTDRNEMNYTNQYGVYSVSYKTEVPHYKKRAEVYGHVIAIQQATIFSTIMNLLNKNVITNDDIVKSRIDSIIVKKDLKNHLPIITQRTKQRMKTTEMFKCWQKEAIKEYELTENLHSVLDEQETFDMPTNEFNKEILNLSSRLILLANGGAGKTYYVNNLNLDNMLFTTTKNVNARENNGHTIHSLLGFKVTDNASDRFDKKRSHVNKNFSSLFYDEATSIDKEFLDELVGQYKYMPIILAGDFVQSLPVGGISKSIKMSKNYNEFDVREWTAWHRFKLADGRPDEKMIELQKYLRNIVIENDAKDTNPSQQICDKKMLTDLKRRMNNFINHEDQPKVLKDRIIHKHQLRTIIQNARNTGKKVVLLTENNYHRVIYNESLSNSSWQDNMPISWKLNTKIYKNGDTGVLKIVNKNDKQSYQIVFDNPKLPVYECDTIPPHVDKAHSYSIMMTQGLTFDHDTIVIVDCRTMKKHRDLYLACSRPRSIENLYLMTLDLPYDQYYKKLNVIRFEARKLCQTTYKEDWLKKLTEAGFTWEDFTSKKIEVDHIDPVEMFDIASDNTVDTVNHINNLQPLKAVDNKKKSNKFKI